jgi:hypothetical protein
VTVCVAFAFIVGCGVSEGREMDARDARRSAVVEVLPSKDVKALPKVSSSGSAAPGPATADVAPSAIAAVLCRLTDPGPGDGPPDDADEISGVAVRGFVEPGGCAPNVGGAIVECAVYLAAGATGLVIQWAKGADPPDHAPSSATDVARMPLASGRVDVGLWTDVDLSYDDAAGKHVWEHRPFALKARLGGELGAIYFNGAHPVFLLRADPRTPAQIRRCGKPRATVAEVHWNACVEEATPAHCRVLPPAFFLRLARPGRVVVDAFPGAASELPNADALLARDARPRRVADLAVAKKGTRDLALDAEVCADASAARPFVPLLFNRRLEWFQCLEPKHVGVTCEALEATEAGVTEAGPCDAHGAP